MTHDHDDVFTWPRMYDAVRRLCTLGAAGRVDARAAELLAPHEPTRLLDVGCGTGALTIALRRRFPDSEIVGVDPGAPMVEHARRKTSDRHLGIDFRVGHGQHLPVDDDAMDAVTISLALHHVPADDVPVVLGEVLRVLRPGGVLLVVELAPVGRLARMLSMHPRGHTLEDYAATLRDAGFTAVRAGRLSARLLGYIVGLVPANGDGATMDADVVRGEDTA